MTRATRRLSLADLLLRLQRELFVRTRNGKEAWAKVIPGETRASAAIDLARSIVRRCERHVAGLGRDGSLPDGAPLRSLNRLADLLFVLARYEEGSFRSLHESD
jgi:cob(I)alamin adenosyltransferase